MSTRTHEHDSKDPKFLDIFLFPMLFVSLMWIVHFAQIALNTKWGYYGGVYPRTWIGLKGILFAPLIHSDIQHLISNSVPMLMLGAIIFYFYQRVALRSFALIYFLSGFVVWAMARPVFHIGASGVVYGLVAFVFWNGIFRRSYRSIILALITIVLYSGYFEGILPNQKGISWESHLYGALVGIFAAYYHKEELELEEEEEASYAPFANELPRENRPYYFKPDTFDKTYKERFIEQQERQERLRQEARLRQAERLRNQSGQSGWTSSSTIDLE